MARLLRQTFKEWKGVREQIQKKKKRITILWSSSLTKKKTTQKQGSVSKRSRAQWRGAFNRDYKQQSAVARDGGARRVAAELKKKKSREMMCAYVCSRTLLV